MDTRVSTTALEASEPRVARLIEHAARLPSPPAIVLALHDLLGDEESSLEEIATYAARDQALTARLLRVANSSYFGLARKVGTVRDAVIVLGTGNVRNLMIATEMLARYPGTNGARADLATFWRHGLLTAFCAAALAQRCASDDGVAFTAALLHDIGKLVLASAHPDEYAASACDAAACLQRERARFGADHAALGAMIAERWGFPHPICEALRSHHEPQALEPLARLVASADRLAHAFDPPLGRDAQLQRCADALVALGSHHTAPELFAEIERQGAIATELAQASA
jgi:putative nucleotidyltransferase with HDIG domain